MSRHSSAETLLLEVGPKIYQNDPIKQLSADDNSKWRSREPRRLREWVLDTLYDP